MPKILVFTQNLDFYSDQLLSGLVEHGYQILVVLSPQPQATAPKWDPRLTIIAEVELRGRLDSQAAAQ
jgi:hypothetical protein